MVIQKMLKYQYHYHYYFWRTLEMLSINSEFFFLTWSKDCVISSAAGEKKLKITDTKHYLPVIMRIRKMRLEKDL